MITKLINSGRLALTFLTTIATGKINISGMPAAVNVELTNVCNLFCPECPSGAGLLTRAKGYMSIDLFDKIISELKPYLLNLNLYFQGESMLHPDFFRFVSMAGGIKITVSTNGHFLTDENITKLIFSDISRLIISLDGTDQSTYSVYRRGGDFETVYNGLRKLIERKRKNGSGPDIVVQYLVHKHNEHQIPAIKNLARENGFKLQLKSMQIISNDFDQWLPSIERFRRYIRDENGYRLKNRLKNRCLRSWFNPVITWDGDVLPCCFDKDGNFVLGNLNNSSFRDIWYGEKNYRFRRMVLSGRSKISMCRNCTEGLHGIVI